MRKFSVGQIMGWRGESQRHSLARRGVKTGRRPDAIMNYSSNVAKGFENRGETGLLAKGFKPTADDKMHAVVFAHDVDSGVSDKLTSKKLDYLIDDETKASKEYDDLGLESLSHDEARHEALLKILKKNDRMPLASHGKKIHTAKFDRCVKKVAKKSKGKVNPYAVCAANLNYEESILPAHRRRS